MQNNARGYVGAAAFAGDDGHSAYMPHAIFVKNFVYQLNHEGCRLGDFFDGLQFAEIVFVTHG